MQVIDINDVRVDRCESAAARVKTIHRQFEAGSNLWITLGRLAVCGAFSKPVIILRQFATGDS